MVTLNKIYTRTGDNGTTSLATGETVPKFDARVEAYGAVDEANAAIGVGNGTTATAATQNDLQASGGTANQIRKAMDSTYPQHTDSTSASAGTVTFRSTYGTADANFHWYEWGVFNGTSGGRMLNRKQEDLGSKTSASTWTFSVSLSLA